MCRISLVELPHHVSHGRQKCGYFYSVVQGVNDVAWDPDDRYLATASDDKTLLLWAVETGEKLRTLEGHTNFVFCCAFNPKQSSLVRSPRWTRPLPPPARQLMLAHQVLPCPCQSWTLPLVGQPLKL